MGVEMPYQPMRNPHKSVSFHRMQEILAKRSGKAVVIGPMAKKADNTAKSDDLSWKRLTADSIKSSRGPVILRTRNSGSPPHDIYVVFSGSSAGEKTAQVLATFNCAQDAKDFVRLLPVDHRGPPETAA